MTSDVHFGKMRKLFGRMLVPLSGALEVTPALLRGSFEPKLSPPVSTMLREAMMTSINHNWKRSTTSAHVSWKRFSFSNFLNTVDLISTNWLDISNVNSAFE